MIVVGDIHGNWSEFELIVNQARDENLFLLSLGDVMDYGFENIRCFTALADLIDNNRAAMLVGNHEFKLFKYINQSREKNIRVKRQGGILSTLTELDKLSTNALEEFEDRFLRICDESYYIVKYNNMYFTHGAIDPYFWNHEEFGKATKNMCMFGQIDMKATPRPNGFPARVYGWVDFVPSHASVVVGHDIRQKHEPFTHIGDRGGKAIFLDTGSSKGGQLSSLKVTS